MFNFKYFQPEGQGLFVVEEGTHLQSAVRNTKTSTRVNAMIFHRKVLHAASLFF